MPIVNLEPRRTVMLDATLKLEPRGTYMLDAYT